MQQSWGMSLKMLSPSLFQRKLECSNEFLIYYIVDIRYTKPSLLRLTCYDGYIDYFLTTYNSCLPKQTWIQPKDVENLFTITPHNQCHYHRHGAHHQPASIRIIANNINIRQGATELGSGGIVRPNPIVPVNRRPNGSRTKN